MKINTIVYLITNVYIHGYGVELIKPCYFIYVNLTVLKYNIIIITRNWGSEDNMLIGFKTDLFA